ncbi:MAG: HlyD family efflux transporter periplasmic adaptor subunit, partial [Gammaproteobacteria bacterium]|nr:HlyD family efflux transporter periplasmic adaptor subunit [Gammaproteobacteria bacterium]
MSACSNKPAVFAITCLIVWVGVAAAKQPERLPVQTRPLEKSTVNEVIGAFGVLEKKPETLYFETAGYLSVLSADEGAKVAKGQVLAKLDTSDIDNQKSQARLAIKYAENKLNKAKKLEGQRALAQDTREDRQHEHALRQLELRKIEVLYRKHFLRAPADGKILERFIEFPAPVTSATPVFIMKSVNRPWRLTVDLSMRQAALVRPGNEVKIVFDGLREQVFTGKLHKITDSAKSADGMVEADILLGETAAGLRAGM